MAVLILNESFPPRIGGVETYMHEAAITLAEGRGPENVIVVAPDDPGSADHDGSVPYAVRRYVDAKGQGYRESWIALSRYLPQWDGRPGTGMRAFPSWTTVTAIGANRHMLRRAAAQVTAAPARSELPLSPDVTVAGTALASGILARVLWDRARVPYAVCTHAAELYEWDRTSRLGRLLRRVLLGASAVGAVSAFTHDRCRELGVSEDRMVRTSPGIDPTPYLVETDPAPVRARYELGDGPLILSHGRLDPRKGNDRLVEAMPTVLGAHPSARLLITGDGECAESLRAQVAQLELGHAVRFGGRVPVEELPALYQCASVFVMASRQIETNVEGFGIVLLEAAAAGTPVLGGNSGGVPDALEHEVTGFLVDPRSSRDLAGRLVELLDAPDRARAMGEAGRARVLDGFDRRAFGRRIAALVARAEGGNP